MKTFHIALALLTVSALGVPAEAQNFRALGTRRGAVAGAVIGGIIGNQNNEAAAGIIVGGLVGGVAGRAIGNQQTRNFNGGHGQSYSSGRTYYQQPTYQQPTYYPAQRYHAPPVQYYRQPTYAPRYHGGGYGNSYRGW